MLCVNLNTVCESSFGDTYFTVFNHCFCNTEYQRLTKNEKKYKKVVRQKKFLLNSNADVHCTYGMIQ